MVDSWSMVEPQILRKGNMATGIYPFNPEKSNNSKYVTENSIVQTIYQPRRQIGYNISNKNLSSDDERISIANYVYKQNYQSIDQIPKPDPRYLNYCLFSSRSIGKGKILSPIPSMISIDIQKNIKIMF